MGSTIFLRLLTGSFSYYVFNPRNGASYISNDNFLCQFIVFVVKKDFPAQLIFKDETPKQVLYLKPLCGHPTLTVTKPPLLSKVPAWIAALQIGDYSS